MERNKQKAEKDENKQINCDNINLVNYVKLRT
jgi:hypothetical protein